MISGRMTLINSGKKTEIHTSGVDLLPSPAAGTSAPQIIFSLQVFGII